MKVVINNRKEVVSNITKNVQKVKENRKIWYRFQGDHYILEVYFIEKKTILIFSSLLAWCHYHFEYYSGTWIALSKLKKIENLGKGYKKMIYHF